MKKYFNSLNVIIVLILFIVFFYITHMTINHNREKTRDRVITSFSTNYFNSNRSISYSDLSNDMKKYITKNQFNSINSWKKAQSLFNSHYQQIKNSTLRENDYDFKYNTVYIENNKEYNIAYEVSFVNTLFNMKINRIVLIIEE